MDYNIYNYFDKDDSLGPEIQTNINGYHFKIGKNVVIHKNINVIGDKTKETYIGHDTYIGENVTIKSGSLIAARNILLKNSNVTGDTRYESVINSNNKTITFDEFVKSIKRFSKISKNKINVALVADDYGRNDQCNQAIEYYLINNIINHASLMVNRGKSTENAISFIKKNNLENQIGLHFNVTDVDNKYSVNILGNVGQKLNSGKLEWLFLNSDEKKVVSKEITAQIGYFKDNNLGLNFFDSHGHIHFKKPICNIIKPILLKNCTTYVRIPMHHFGKEPPLKKIYNFFYKNRVEKEYSNSFQHFNLFIRAINIFNLDNKFIGKSVEVMTHPFAYDDRYANRRDIDFTCLLGFIVDNSIFQII